MRAKNDGFLREIGLHPDFADIGKISGDFAREMERGLRGEAGSLRMIPTYIPAAAPPETSEPVIALDAGGTNFRSALVELCEGANIVTSLRADAMPGTRGEVSLREFLDFICSRIEPFLVKTHRIGLCFSFAFDSTPELDGRVVSLSKQVKIAGVEGTMLGAALKKRLRERGASHDVHIAVINDAAAALLGGLAAHGLRGAPASLILGTGLNMCSLERGDAIKKLPGERDMLINLEAGNFNLLPLCVPDRIIDAKSDNPGEHLLEKAVSGAYVGSLTLEALRLAASSGLLSPEASERIMTLKTLEMRETDAFFTAKKPPLCESDEDAEALRAITAAVYERAARYVCAMLEAVATRSKERLFVTADGSVFYRSEPFRKRLFRHITERSLPLEFQKADNGNLIGAALAALAREDL